MKYFDKAGSPITLLDWAQKFEDMDYRRVGLYDNDGVFISTVWLGSSHNFNDDGPPLIFETLASGGDFGEETMRRYSTLAQAQCGHALFLAKVLNAGK